MPCCSKYGRRHLVHIRFGSGYCPRGEYCGRPRTSQRRPLGMPRRMPRFLVATRTRCDLVAVALASPKLGHRPLRYESRHNRVSRSFPTMEGDMSETSQPEPESPDPAPTPAPPPPDVPEPAPSPDPSPSPQPPPGTPPSPRDSCAAAPSFPPASRHNSFSPGTAWQGGRFRGLRGSPTVITNAVPRGKCAGGSVRYSTGAYASRGRRRSSSFNSWPAEVLASCLRPAVKLSDQEGCK